MPQRSAVSCRPWPLGEARRQIKSGGLKLNDAAVLDERAALSAADFNADGVAKLSMGKKKHVLLKLA